MRADAWSLAQYLREGVSVDPKGPLYAAATTAGNDSEHALDGEATLCGVARRDVTVFRHPFALNPVLACPECADQYVRKQSG